MREMHCLFFCSFPARPSRNVLYISKVIDVSLTDEILFVTTILYCTALLKAAGDFFFIIFIMISSCEYIRDDIEHNN